MLSKLHFKIGRICSLYTEEEPSLEASSEDEASESDDEEEVAPKTKKTKAGSAGKRTDQARSSARSRGPTSAMPIQAASTKKYELARKPVVSLKVTSTRKVPQRKVLEEAATPIPPALGLEAGADGAEEISEASQRRKEENIKAMLGQK